MVLDSTRNSLDKDKQFFCEHYACTLSYESCIQRRVISRKHKSRYTTSPLNLRTQFSECKKCNQGKEIEDMTEGKPKDNVEPIRKKRKYTKRQSLLELGKEHAIEGSIEALTSKKVEVSFEVHEQLLDQICKQAREEYRTPELQILYLLNHAVLENG